MFSLDHLNPTEFEQFCYDLLQESGFFNLSWRKGTGLNASPSDQGRDIECYYKLEDIDGNQYIERWFVECKHYKQGVPPTELQGALAWSMSEETHVLLIIASNFLSNPAKNYLENYKQNNKPRFRIKIWEKTDLEKLTANKSLLLRKYNIVGEFPFLSILHPAHILYMRNINFNSLNYLFEILDELEPEERDRILSWISFALVQAEITEYHTATIFGQKVTSPVFASRNARHYEKFKDSCYEIVENSILDEPLLVFLIVNWILQSQFSISDITSIDKFITDKRKDLEVMGGEFQTQFVKTDEDYEALEKMKSHLQGVIDKAHENIHCNYDSYVYFCENVVASLLTEKVF